MLNKLAPQNFNDTLALILIFIIPILWVLCGFAVIKLESEVTGALIVTWTIIIQHYYRKAQSEKH
jgi:hypothetical protein